MIPVRVLISFIYYFIFTHSFISADNDKTNIYFNYGLETAPCLTPTTESSFNECLKRYEENLETTNIMVYQRMFLLCQLCFITKVPMKIKQPGFILAHKRLNDTSQTNLARGKHSNQSSTYHDKRLRYATANLAVDGIWDSNMYKEGIAQCSHTNFSSIPHWWMVNFEYPKLVAKILILNRSDCCWERLSNVTVTVGDSANEMKHCGTFIGPGRNGELVNITCTKPMFGQYLRIEKPGPSDLTLCEVGVYS